MTVRILTDSTCDLPAEIIEKLAIRVVPYYIHIGSRDLLDGVEISRADFYKNLPTYEDHPTTAVPSHKRIHTMYEELAAEGATEILSIHISESLSAIVNVALTAAAETTSVPVTVFDSHQLSLGTGFLVQTAAELARQGRSVSEIIPILEDQTRRTYVAASLETLKFLRRGGRMERVVSTIGELLHIKPILKMHDGVSAIERFRTRQQAMNRLVEMLKSYAPFEKIAFLHSNALETAQLLRDKVQDLLPDTETWLEMINPVLGTHIGPGVVGFAAITRK